MAYQQNSANQRAKRTGSAKTTGAHNYEFGQELANQTQIAGNTGGANQQAKQTGSAKQSQRHVPNERQ